MKSAQNHYTKRIGMVAEPKTNEDNLNNVRRKISRPFRIKTRGSERENNDLVTNRENKNIRDLYTVINEFEKG
jgi:hypothetical protein